MRLQEWQVCEMLEQMLSLIRSSGTVSPVELGRRMNISPGMVQVLLDDLLRRGILHSFEMQSNCQSETCSGCALASGCQSAKPRIWEIKSG
jgi:DNA-binding Lrp family transcriptional regulator